MFETASLWGNISLHVKILVRVKLGHPPEFQLPRQPHSGRKIRAWKKKEERIMPSLLATTSALTCTPCVRTHYIRTKISFHQLGPKAKYMHT